MRQSCNFIVDDLEGVVFHSIHYVAGTIAFRVLGPNGRLVQSPLAEPAVLVLAQPNWRVVREYAEALHDRSVAIKRKRKRRS